MQIKTTMRYHPTVVRMAIILKSTNNKYERGYGEKGALLHGRDLSWWSHYGKQNQVSSKNLNESRCMNQQSHFWVYIWTKLQFKKIQHPYVHSITIQNSQDMATKYMSTDRWMDKEDVIHTYNGILLSPPPKKKEWNSDICSDMDGRREHHTK